MGPDVFQTLYISSLSVWPVQKESFICYMLEYLLLTIYNLRLVSTVLANVKPDNKNKPLCIS